MLARALRFLLLLEITGYGGFSWYFVGLNAAAAFGIGVLALLLVRALVILATWCFAWWLRSPAQPLGVPRALAMMVLEYGAFVLHFVILMPFAGFWMGRDRLRRTDRPLLLVHGHGCNRACWWWLRRRLEAAGHVVASIDLEPPWGSIDDFARQLAARIDAVLTVTGASQVTLVVHSMGGLVSRALLRDEGGARVAAVVTLATPHTGSWLARLGWGINARQMEPASPWLQQLASAPCPVPLISVRTEHDNFVLPQARQCLPGALDVPLPGVGHLALLFSPRLVTWLCSWLQAGVPPEHTDG